MQRYEIYVPGYFSPLTADEIAEHFRFGKLRLSDPCKAVGAVEWRTIDELFPLLKYDSTGGIAPPRPTSKRPSILDYSDAAGDVQRPMSSALKAGWICFGIGMLLSWFLPLGHVFYSIAIITAIVAMCTHQVTRGLALLLSTFVAMIVSAAVFFVLVVGAVSAAAAPTMKRAEADLRRTQQEQDKLRKRMTATSAQMQSALTRSVPSRPAHLAPQATGRSNDPFDSRRQHQLARGRQRQEEERARRDESRRQQNIRDAERNRDMLKARQQRIELLQKSIDWYDEQIKRARLNGWDWQVFSEPRDRLLRQKSDLQQGR